MIVLGVKYMASDGSVTNHHHTYKDITTIWNWIENHFKEAKGKVMPTFDNPLEIEHDGDKVRFSVKEKV